MILVLLVSLCALDLRRRPGAASDDALLEAAEDDKTVCRTPTRRATIPWDARALSPSRTPKGSAAGGADGPGGLQQPSPLGGSLGRRMFVASLSRQSK